MPKKCIPAFAVFIILAFACQASAQPISDPENVSYMSVDVTQSGSINLKSLSALSMAEQLRVIMYVPQNDSRQMSAVRRVIGPDSYRFSDDGYGNRQIILEWKNPPLDKEIDYLVESRVVIDSEPVTESRMFPLTDAIAPSEDIIERAYELGSGGKSAENMLSIASWVNSYVDYDSAYESHVLPAEWVYSNRRGTCDEFSVLLLSTLRVLDYRSWYVAGYAYLGGKQEGESSFGAHAWVEAEYGGRTYTIDPTWAESPVDATHLTLARLPDSNFTEQTEVKSRDVEIQWNKDDTRLQTVEYRESPRVSFDLEAVPSEVLGGKNVLVLADMSADGCVLSRLRLVSCVRESGKPLIDIGQSEKSVVFCGNMMGFWTGATPEVNYGTIYRCPISAAVGGGGARSSVTISATVGRNIILTVSTQKIVIPGQAMGVDIRAQNTGRTTQDLRIFTMLDGEISEWPLSVVGRGEETVRAELKAPATTGTYSLVAFSSSGDMVTEDITVISERQLKMTEILKPEKVRLGESAYINVTIKNFGERSGGSLKMQIGEHEETRAFVVGAGGTEVVGFFYQPDSAGEKILSLALLDSGNGYQDGWVGRIEVTQELSFKDTVASQIEDFFAWIIGGLRSLFGVQ